MSLKSGVLSLFLGAIVSVLFRLLGVFDTVRYAYADTDRTLEATLDFWRPVFISTIVLFVLIYVAVYLTPTGKPDTEDEDKLRKFDTMDYTLQDADVLSTALAQLQFVLDNQLETLADIDDKALRTVRVQVILLGVIASAAQITSRPIPVNIWMKAGGVLVIGSVIAGIFTYTVSDGRAGPRPEDVSRILATHGSKSAIYLRLLEKRRAAISENRAILQDNGRYIFYTQLLLVLGVLFGAVGVLLAMRA
ncbi:hypothetical protein [Halorussus amylolyticus]|uniref:hypothetical protein n=1 Tax=Halorussus amylolyticus TaxID=1126242 RepID=UPI0010528ED7|nr:hypothetical protein [Halorussus amylolyticus]